MIDGMVDVYSSRKRSRIMAAIGSKNTKPELAVRRMLHGLGYRYRLHTKELPGKPDLYFSGRRKAVLINGCFWHGHEGCSRAALPTSNAVFWQNKIAKNVARDKLNKRRLREMGVKSLVIWQCDMRDLKRLERRLIKFLGARRIGEKAGR